MPVQRTPPRESTDVAHQVSVSEGGIAETNVTINPATSTPAVNLPTTETPALEATRPPAAKLAVVTRKRNEIEQLLLADSPDKDALKLHYQEYLQRVDKLYEACGEDHQDWLLSHNVNDVEFRQKLHHLLYEPARSLRSQSSVSRSSSGSTQSVRLRIAKLKAEHEIADRTMKLKLQESRLKMRHEEENMKLQEERARIEMQKTEKELKYLEQGMDSVNEELSDKLDSPPANSANKDAVAMKVVWEKQAEIAAAISSCQLKMDLPKKEILYFDGSDVTHYKKFRLSFDRSIGQRCTDDGDKYVYLQQYTKGKANILVNTCCHYDAATAYKKAIKLLDDEYDNEFIVSNSYIEKLDRWPEVKSEDKKALEDYAIFLIECNNYMELMSVRNSLQSPKEMSNIVSKLPFKLRDRWRRRNLNLTRTYGYSRFKDLVEFVKEESDLLKQPVFGKIVDTKTDKSKDAPKHKKQFATNTKETPIVSNVTDSSLICTYCKKRNHAIVSCKFFEKLDFREKSKFIRKSELCYACLRRGHFSANCPGKLVCAICEDLHPTVMHIVNKQTTNDPSNTEAAEQSQQTSSCASISDTVLGTDRNINKVITPTVLARIKVHGNEESVVVACALDSCSTDCWINEKLLSYLNVFPAETTVDVSTMNGKNETKTRVLNNLQVSDIHGNFSATIPVIYTKPETQWPFSKSDLITRNDVKDYTHLRDVPFDFSNEDVGLLIGINVPSILRPREVIYGNENDPFASLHSLGWALNGPVKRSGTGKSCCRTSCVDTALDESIHSYFSRDYVDDSIKREFSHNDKLWLDNVESNIVKGSDNHFTVDLPFRSSVNFPNNRSQIEAMFYKLKSKLEKNNSLLEDYSEYMRIMTDNNFVERVPDNELNTKPGKSWYINHHGVYHKQKHKLRIVFNCSLKYKGISLNDNLCQGPDLTNNLQGVLLRFRREPVAIVADVQKMFYQVRVNREHVDYLRFFWFDPNDYTKVVEYRLLVHVFGATSSPSVANFALRRTAANSADPAVVRAINKDFYVDDLLTSVATEQEAVSLYSNVKETLFTGGFKLACLDSNSATLLNSFPEDSKTKTNSNHAISEDKFLADSSRALGVVWSTKSDTFGYDVNFEIDNNITKRVILRKLASVYDPLGLASPAIVAAKKLFQQACNLKIGWDELLPVEMCRTWYKWINSIKTLSCYSVPRCLKYCKDVTRIELHMFSDGGETAYGCVAYIKYVYVDNSCSSMLLCSKSRLTPLNNRTLKTVPRIELCAAKLAVELSIKIKTEIDLNLSNIVFWTDSVTVLRYIKNDDGRYHRFVANKVAFIRNYSEQKNWYFVPSKLNPADIVSRGAAPSAIQSSVLWKLGPHFLIDNDIPAQNVNYELLEDDIEVKSPVKTCVTDVVANSVIDKLMCSVSNWQKLKRRVASVLRLKSCLQNMIAFSRDPFTALELSNAEHCIFAYLQEKYFGLEYNNLVNGKVLPKSSKMKKLCPFIDDKGLIRVGGRIENSDLLYDARHPIILPRSLISNSLIRDTHRSVGHLGRETVLAKLRENYWIFGANVVVRSVVRNCILCRKLHGKTSQQLMSELPAKRVTGDVPVFTHVGCDNFGPFFTVQGRKSVKRYGVIFVCMASRAVHLEVSHSLSTDSFVNALRRFISRRGNVKSITSDNGTNLVSANKEIRESVKEWNHHYIGTALAQQQIEWCFNTPGASHFGGFYERLIRSVRKVFDALLNSQVLKMNDEELCTLMCEAESILNSRPLTDLPDDPNCLALTPNHLLLLNAGITFPPGLFSRDDCYVKRRWRQTQYLVDQFWFRWKKEYLVGLQERQKWLVDANPHKVGDLVLVVDVNLPRNQWPLGRIVGITSCKYGRVRSASVRVSRCKNTSLTGFESTIVERPIVKLVLLRSVDDL